MIQDITPHHYYNEYHAYRIQNGDYVLFYNKREVLLRYDEDQIVYPRYEEISEREDRQYRYLFSIDDLRYFWCEEMDDALLQRYQFVNIFKMRKAQPKYRAFAGVTGLQLSEWYRSRRFCGRCGTRMVHSDKERMMQCPECGLMEYPKLSPAVIIGLVHGNKILMSKYAGRTYKNYALLAGFSEIGESVEETVRREVMEEVGLKAGKLHYYKSQPWSFTDTLLMGFYAELEGGEDITLDQTELSMAEWFEREEIPVTYEDCSLTNEMIMAFKEGKMTWSESKYIKKSF